MSADHDLGRRLSRLLGPDAPEVSCDLCFEQLDAFVEHELGRTDADTIFPGMRAHFLGCPACAQEHDALLELARLDAEY